MATEKILNTRIINKHALLSEWNSSTLALKEGEIALARIELTNNNPTSGENNNISTTPAYIIKVGAKDANGTEQNFDNSAWAYAKAVDVYAWAKQANLPVVCADDKTVEGYVAGNVISSIYFENDEIKYTTATVATSEGFEALTEKVAAIEGYLELSQDEDGNTVVGLVNRVSALETLVGDTSVSEQISSAIETLIGDDITITDLATLKSDLKTTIQGDTTTTVNELESELDTLVDVTIPQLHSELQGDTSSTIGDVENQVSDLAGDGRTTETVKGNADAIAEINTWISGDEPGAESRISNLETAVNGTEANPGGLILAANNATDHIANTSNPHNVTATQVGLGNVENKSTATIKAEFTGTIAAGDTGFVTGDAVYDVKAVADDAQSKIDTFLASVTPDGADNIIDTLQEINDYVGEHGEAFTALSTKVTKIENGTTVVPKATHAVNADEAGHATSADNATNAQNANHAASADEATHATSADNATKAADSDNLGGKAPTFYATADSVTDITKTGGVIDTKIAALDVSDITGMGAGKTIKTLTETDGIIAAEFQDIAISKSQITDFNESDYATKEQGAKADTAIQGIFTDTDGGPGHYHYVKGLLTVEDNLIVDGDKMWILKEAVENGVQYASNGLEIVDKAIPGGSRKEVKIDTATKTKIDNAVQSSEVAVYTQAGYNGSPNTIVKRDENGNIYSAPLKSADTTIADYTKISDSENRVITGGDLRVILDNYKENVVAIKDHSISAHQTKACKDYTGDDAEVWVFDCGGAE